MKLLIIADDFTGANDSGVQLAKKGAQVEVHFNGSQKRESRADVVVINTDSRALDPATAADRVSECIKTQLENHQPIVYKKIDSTLRGNLGAEITAALMATAANIAIVAPAIPAAGRTTENGECWVHGVPLIETEFVHDPKTPITSSSIKQILKKQSTLPIAEIKLASLRLGMLVEEINQLPFDEKQIVIIDAVTDDDLQHIAQSLGQLNRSFILVGAAGLANALPVARYRQARLIQPVLAVAGSMSDTIKTQIDYALKHSNMVKVDIDIKVLMSDAEGVADYTQQALLCLTQKKHCVLYTCASADARQNISQLCTCFDLTRVQLGEKISQKLALLTVDILRQTAVGALFLTGGDVAQAVAHAVGARGYRIENEIAPCIPSGYFIDSEIDRIPVITKAGGFGSDCVLHDIFNFIEEQTGEK